MANDRRLKVLSAIVTDYVRTREPVGSKALVERYRLGVSPATIRNDMAALEDEGYIHQPHTSAGRVPTQKGYRLFVDEVARIKPLSVPERAAITALLSGAVDLEQVVARTVRALAQLTGQLAVVEYPSLRYAALQHLELVALGPERVLLVIITDTGRVDQRTVTLRSRAGTSPATTEPSTSPTSSTPSPWSACAPASTAPSWAAAPPTSPPSWPPWPSRLPPTSGSCSRPWPTSSSPRCALTPRNGSSSPAPPTWHVPRRTSPP